MRDHGTGGGEVCCIPCRITLEWHWGLGCAVSPIGPPLSAGFWHCCPQTQLICASELQRLPCVQLQQLPTSYKCAVSLLNSIFSQLKSTAELCSPDLCLFGSQGSSEELCSPSSSYSCPCGYPSRAEAGTAQVTSTSFL